MRKIILAILLAMSIDGMAQKIDNDSINWSYLKNAIDSGVPQFMHHNNKKIPKFTVFVIDIVDLGSECGEFSISYINNVYRYNEINPSNYCVVENQIVIVRARTSAPNNFDAEYLPLITDSVKQLVMDVLPQQASAKNNYRETFITGQDPPIMVVTYNKDVVTTTYYGLAGKADKKYR